MNSSKTGHIHYALLFTCMYEIRMIRKAHKNKSIHFALMNKPVHNINKSIHFALVYKPVQNINFPTKIFEC